MKILILVALGICTSLQSFANPLVVNKKWILKVQTRGSDYCEVTLEKGKELIFLNQCDNQPAYRAFCRNYQILDCDFHWVAVASLKTFSTGVHGVFEQDGRIRVSMNACVLNVRISGYSPSGGLFEKMFEKKIAREVRD